VVLMLDYGHNTEHVAVFKIVMMPPDMQMLPFDKEDTPDYSTLIFSLLNLFSFRRVQV
jgi:hypothetical protein